MWLAGSRGTTAAEVPARADPDAGPGPIAIGLFVAYAALLLGIMLTQGVEALPDRYAVAMLVGAVILGRAKRFVVDWFPFVGLLISYDFLRGFAYDLGTRAQFTDSISIDQALFGTVPTVTLQRWLLGPTLHWYDYLATLLYFLHFALPLAFAMLLWVRQRRRFTDFAVSLTILSYAAWVTYLVFPSAPPWLAAQSGHLDGVTRVLDRSIDLFPGHVDLPTIYNSIDPNPVAAIPSLHAAYPFLVMLYALRFFRWRGLVVAVYVAAAWWAVVYLGEHYATDVIAGAVYATGAFFAGPAVVRWLARVPRPAVRVVVPARYR